MVGDHQTSCNNMGESDFRRLEAQGCIHVSCRAELRVTCRLPFCKCTTGRHTCNRAKEILLHQ